MSDQASVLIVDDSAFMRSIVGKIVEAADGLTVAGKAMNGVFALKKIATSHTKLEACWYEFVKFHTGLSGGEVCQACCLALVHLVYLHL